MSEVRVKRAYDPPSDDDGFRVLVDRLWPRGLARDGARIDLWLKEVAPSAALRRWFSHDPVKWPEFQDRYQTELAGNGAVDNIMSLMKEGQRVTMLYGAKDVEHNNAIVLKKYCERSENHGRV